MRDAKPMAEASFLRHQVHAARIDSLPVNSDHAGHFPLSG